MLQPNRTKYRRPHRLSYEGKAKGGTKVEATVSKIEVKKTPLRGTTLKQYTPVFTYMLNSSKHTKSTGEYIRRGTVRNQGRP